MNPLTSQQRKIAYLVGIVVLLVPIILLGMPSTGDEDNGGRLAELRQEYDLGESSLGDVDPASATMNLVLLGLRGVAANLLWMQMEEQKNTKNWAQMRATTESIIKLQPHYVDVWRFNSWNLAYNVSAEWDAVEDRFYWVKEGAKFLMRGKNRNEKYPELYWETGRILGPKIGTSDEWRYFRKFFKSDPNTDAFGGGPDPDINNSGEDNYLRAKDWFQQANNAEAKPGIQQHIMMRALFRSYPARAQLDYADALQREGLFGEVSRVEWDRGFQEWTNGSGGEIGYGKMVFYAPGCEIFFEADEDDIRELAKRNEVEERVIRHWIDRYTKTVNYRYWRTKSLSESESETAEAHRQIHLGKTNFEDGDLTAGEAALLEGMSRYKRVLAKYPTLAEEELSKEKGLWAVLMWQKIKQLKGTELPADYPLKVLWDNNLRQIPELQSRFRREFGSK